MGLSFCIGCMFRLDLLPGLVKKLNPFSWHLDLTFNPGLLQPCLISSLLPLYLCSGLAGADLKPMSLGLSHSLSRYKLKFSPDKVRTAAWCIAACTLCCVYSCVCMRFQAGPSLFCQGYSKAGRP